jgi:hypothetical protein
MTISDQGLLLLGVAHLNGCYDLPAVKNRPNDRRPMDHSLPPLVKKSLAPT